MTRPARIHIRNTTPTLKQLRAEAHRVLGPDRVFVHASNRMCCEAYRMPAHPRDPNYVSFIVRATSVARGREQLFAILRGMPGFLASVSP